MSSIAPWPDFAGNEIHEGDTIIRPSGECGVVVKVENQPSVSDEWRVDYGLGHLSRLCLQLGDRGKAVVVKPKP